MSNPSVYQVKKELKDAIDSFDDFEAGFVVLKRREVKDGNNHIGLMFGYTINEVKMVSEEIFKNIRKDGRHDLVEDMINEITVSDEIVTNVKNIETLMERIMGQINSL